MMQQYILRCEFPGKEAVYFKDSLSVSIFLKSEAPKTKIYSGISTLTIESMVSCRKPYRLWKPSGELYVKIEKHPLFEITL